MSESSAVVSLSDASTVADVGGKAASLGRMAGAGYRVPDGVVLPVDWFAPWWAELWASPAWAEFEKADGPPWSEHAGALSALARGLAYSDAMRVSLELVAGRAAEWGDGATCAVRSSSPDEDLATASFAGGYETVLGVSPSRLADAVRACFVSCLAERVLAYKSERGLDVHRPRIAVVIQRQLASEVSGVAFSLNPLTNDFDEAVIDANFGLGESVVSGEVTPDHFVVDKPSGEIRERHTGAKELSRWLGAHGAVDVRREPRADEVSLSDRQVKELCRTLTELESLYGHPVDIEWAYVQGELHLLQARPVTTYVPLPDEMQTKPGEPRMLYIDGGLSDKFTINAPISALGLDAYTELMIPFLDDLGMSFDPGATAPGDIAIVAGCRPYATISPFLWFIKPDKVASQTEMIDVHVSEALRSIDISVYRPKQKPAWASARRMIPMVLRALWGTRVLLRRSLVALCARARFFRRYREESARFERELSEASERASLSELRRWNERVWHQMICHDLPAVVAMTAGFSLLDRLGVGQSDEVRALLDRVARGFEGELVVDMGIDLFDMAQLLEPGAFDDLDALAGRIEARELPAEFSTAWDAFQQRYGARGPLEMDLRSPRYGDTPKILLRQMSFVAGAGDEIDPGRTHASHVEDRKAAVAELMKRFGSFRRLQLRLAHAWSSAYAPERDHAKHHWVMHGYGLRRAALAAAKQFVDEKRLDQIDDVFHLRFEELEAAARDPSLDLRALVAQRKPFFELNAAQVREFPHLIDSRGRIVRPDLDPGEGGLKGMGISPGVARGPARVLRDPYEKDVEPGDVLIAYTTDPGWTPLFINAAAVVLQIGGMMQHGGVVAREYGKPCVAGIQGVLTRFEDGQLLEVDGSSGVVRVLG